MMIEVRDDWKLQGAQQWAEIREQLKNGETKHEAPTTSYMQSLP